MPVLALVADDGRKEALLEFAGTAGKVLSSRHLHERQPPAGQGRVAD